MNNKHFTHLLILSLITVLLAVLWLVPSYAEQTEAELIRLDETTNLKVSVEYTDNGTGIPPVISFRDSWGTVLEEGPDCGLTADYYEGAIVYTLPDLSSGTWYIIYDDSFAGHLHVTTAPYARLLTISDFGFEIRGNYVYADLLVDSEIEYGTYTAEFSIVTLDENGLVSGSRLVGEKTGGLNYPEHYSFDIEELATYDSYYLEVEIYMEDNGMETSTNKIAGPFSYESDDMLTPLDGIRITADLKEAMLDLDWTPYSLWRAEKYIIGVFKNSESEPFFSAEYEADVTDISVNYPEDADTVRVCITYTDNYGYISETLTKMVDLKVLTVSFNIADGFSSSSVNSFEYEVKGTEIELYAYRNGEIIGSSVLSGNGTMNFNAADGVNTISLCYFPDDDTVVFLDYEFFCDTMPPILLLYEIDGDVKTKDTSYIIAGSTEPGAEITVNGKIYETDENGIFTVEVPLVSGDNEIEITSKDAVGNKTVKVFNINCLNRKAGSAWSSLIKNVKLLLVCAGVLVVSMGILITAAILAKKSSKWTVGDKLKAASVFTWIAAGIFGAGAIYATVQRITYSKIINSLDYIDIAKKSIDEAADMLDKAEMYKSLMIALWIAFGVSALAAIILTIIGRKKK